MEELLELDRELFLFLNNLGTDTWDWFWLFITEKWASLPLYLFSIILMIRLLGWKTTGVILVTVALMITCTDQLSNFFKDTFERLRPCNMDFMSKGRFVADYCGGYGFFSAHACSSFAFAIFLGKILRPYYKYAMLGMLIWASFVSYSRIYIGVHYPGDTLVGLLFGLLIGLIFYYVQHYLRRWLHLNGRAPKREKYATE